MSTDLVQVQTKNLETLLEKSKSSIAAALPKHVTPERMLRIALTEARKNPDLLQCDQASFLGALIQASQVGLEPGGALGHCYLVPFNNKNAGRKEVQFMLGYRGMLDLVRRSNACTHVTARAVYEGDEFSYEYGLEEKLVHKTHPTPNAKLTHVYAIAFMKEGKPLFDVMDVVDIEMIRQRAQAQKGPWVTDYDAMAKKSVIRRLFKYMPVSIEVQQAIGLDELADAGVSQGNNAFIETEGRHVPDKVQGLEAKLGLVKTAPEVLPPVAEAPQVVVAETPKPIGTTPIQIPESNLLAYYEMPEGPLKGKMLKDVEPKILAEFYDRLKLKRAGATGKWLELLSRLDEVFAPAMDAAFADDFSSFAPGGISQ